MSRKIPFARVSSQNRLDLGVLELTEGSYDLEIKIVEASRTQDPVFREVKGILVRKTKP